MDPVLRSRRLLLTAFALAASALAGTSAVACAGARGSGTPVGVSTASHGHGERPDDGGLDGSRRGAGLPADFKTKNGYTKVNRTRFVSNGHAAGRWDVDIYVSTSAKEAYASAAGEVPVGARLVKEHFERAGAADASDPTGPIMMMEKMEKGFDPDHGDWRYVVVNSAGAVVEDGRVESCAGCHDDAPHDHIFRVDQ
ncbi:MAG: hypothetical protein JWM74_1127 [Myxococcaceae bacterium]|nr:hypothetical protein [Myxococcaceae bacterium]